MIRLVLSLSLFFSFACAHPNVNSVTLPNEDPVNINGVLALLYPNGNAGHACPCDGQIYTARHIVQGRMPDGGFSWYFNTFTYEDGYGNVGFAKGINADPYRDLGVLTVLPELEEFFYYKTAKARPEIGEPVFWVEFSDKDFTSVKRKSHVKSYFAGYIFTDRLPVPGASGSCIFNAKGEVIGIVVWGMIKNNISRGVGVLLVE